MTGVQPQQVLADRSCSLPIVFISGTAISPSRCRRSRRCAEDFPTKPVSQSQLLETIDRALNRGEVLRGVQSEKTALTARLETLTPRERQVFEQLVRGLPHKQISHLLGISDRRSSFTATRSFASYRSGPWQNLQR